MVIIVENDFLWAKALARIIDDDVEITGNIVDAMRLTWRHRPRAIVVDVNLENDVGTDHIAEFLRVSPKTRVIVITGKPVLGIGKEIVETRGAYAYLNKVDALIIPDLVFYDDDHGSGSPQPQSSLR